MPTYGSSTTRRPSPFAMALALAASTIVVGGAAWVGYTSRPAPRPAAAMAPSTASAQQVGTGLPPDAQTLLDGGNSAFRAGNFEAALQHYRAAAEKAPRHAAPWIGVHMAAQKLGNKALADSAFTAIQQRTGEAAVWTDSAARRAHESPRGQATAPVKQ